MKIYIENQTYSLEDLNNFLPSDLYTVNNITNTGKIDYIGYLYNYKIKKPIYLLPKIFSDNDLNLNTNLSYILILFYKSLKRFKEKYDNSSRLELKSILNSNLGHNELSYLDVILSIINFYKENKNFLTFKLKENLSQNFSKKTNWDKTISNTKPLFINNTPVYLSSYQKTKKINDEEILLKIFYSVVFYIDKEFKFNLSISHLKNFIYKPKEFEKIKRKSPKFLKNLRHKYFSDKMIKIYKLLVAYFSLNGDIKINKKEEYILVRDYHKVFEEMVDFLISDDISDSLKELKFHKDGKILDHIFKYKSLINPQKDIYYIGDSKYYKNIQRMDIYSKYKQFTYAKNVIQFHIDLINQTINIDNLEYRDPITEGYNITPNFFITPIIDSNINDPKLNLLNINPILSSHFIDRLFDRDTLHVLYFSINFLFLLKIYALHKEYTARRIKNNIKEVIRSDFINYLNDKYYFFKKIFKNYKDLRNLINQNCKILNGKIYSYKLEDTYHLIVASEKIYFSFNEELKNFLNLNAFEPFILE
ncbi:LlaJI family restriction endonuclease [Persephonella sp.]